MVEGGDVAMPHLFSLQSVEHELSVMVLSLFVKKLTDFNLTV